MFGESMGTGRGGWRRPGGLLGACLVLAAGVVIPSAAYGRGGGGDPGSASVSGSSGSGPDPVLVRQAAFAAGLDSLHNVKVPEPSNLGDFVASRPMLIALGKALFWDMQVGSDGVACAS